MMDRNTLIKDYAAIIDKQREEIETLYIVLNNVQIILTEALRYPWQQDKEVKPAIEVVTILAEDAKDRIYHLNKTCTYLRKELADPPPDVQEYILQKLDIYKSAIESTELIRKLQDEIARLTK